MTSYGSADSSDPRPHGIVCKTGIEPRCRMDEIVAAHRYMEDNRGSGKLVIVTDSASVDIH